MQLYFAVAIPSENDEDSAWLLAPISSGKLLKAEKNAIEIRDLLLNSESLLFKIEEMAHRRLKRRCKRQRRAKAVGTISPKKRFF